MYCEFIHPTTETNSRKDALHNKVEQTISFHTSGDYIVTHLFSAI